MKMRADAFVYVPDVEVGVGQLFTAGGQWLMRVQGRQPEFNGYIRLNGDHAGSIAPCSGNRVLALAPGLTWRATMPIPDPEYRGPRSGAIVISDKGPVIWGTTPNGERLAYYLNGAPATDIGVQFEDGPAVTNWTAELIAEGALDPLGTLFELPVREFRQ